MYSLCWLNLHLFKFVKRESTFHFTNLYYTLQFPSSSARYPKEHCFAEITLVKMCISLIYV